MASFEEADKAINECIEAYVAAKVSEALALFHAQECRKVRDECQYDAENAKLKELLFKRDEEG